MPSFGELLTGLFGVAVAGTGAQASAYDADATVAAAERLEPFATLSQQSSAGAAREMCLAIADVMTAQQGRSADRLRALADRLRKGGDVRRLNDEVRQQMQLGCIYLAGINDVLEGADGALQAAERLEREPREFSKPRAELLRMCHFGFRGEQDLADLHRLRAERLSLLGGNSWSALTAMAVRSLVIALWTRDSVGMARALDDCDRIGAIAPGLRPYREIAEAWLEFSRGRPELSIETHERLLRAPRRFALNIWALQIAHYAEVLGSLGRHAQARQVCVDALARVLPDNRRLRILHQLLVQELALAEARLGDPRGAGRRLDSLLAELANLDNPLVRGTAHRDRARVALLCRDRKGFDRHLIAMAEQFRATRNPCLIQQCDALSAQAISTGVHPIPAAFAEARARSVPTFDSLDGDTVIEPFPIERGDD